MHSRALDFYCFCPTKPPVCNWIRILYNFIFPRFQVELTQSTARVVVFYFPLFHLPHPELFAPPPRLCLLSICPLFKYNYYSPFMHWRSWSQPNSSPKPIKTLRIQISIHLFIVFVSPGFSSHVLVAAAILPGPCLLDFLLRFRVAMHPLLLAMGLDKALAIMHHFHGICCMMESNTPNKVCTFYVFNRWRLGLTLAHLYKYLVMFYIKSIHSPLLKMILLEKLVISDNQFFCCGPSELPFTICFRLHPFLFQPNTGIL